MNIVLVRKCGLRKVLCISVHSVVKAILVPGDRFLESPGNFSGQESCFMLAILPFKIEFSCILKMIQWSYHSFGIFSILLSFHLSSPVSIAEKRTARLQYWFKLTPLPPPKKKTSWPGLYLSCVNENSFKKISVFVLWNKWIKVRETYPPWTQF